MQAGRKNSKRLEHPKKKGWHESVGGVRFFPQRAIQGQHRDHFQKVSKNWLPKQNEKQNRCLLEPCLSLPHYLLPSCGSHFTSSNLKFQEMMTVETWDRKEVEQGPGQKLEVGGSVRGPNIHVGRASNNLASHCDPFLS